MHTRETEKPRWFSRNRRPPLKLALLCLCLGLSAFAHAQDPGPRDEEGLQWRDGEQWKAGLVMDTAVDMRIHGLIADVRVRQIYRNDSSTWQEGRYLLPLPDNAAVDTLTVHVGERVIEGEIRENAQARALYEAAASNGQRASLVEQNRPNLFRTAIANIAPNEEVEIELHYWQPVTFADGEFSLALPLTLTPRYTPGSGCERCDVSAESLPSTKASRVPHWSLPPAVSVRAVIEPGLPLDTVESSSHTVTVMAEGDTYRVELASLAERSDRDFVLRWQPTPSRTPRSAVFTEQIDGDTYAQVMLVPPTVPAAPLPRELILVIDNSGSMSGTSMDQAKQAADQALARLRPGDRFNVIRFDDTFERLFPQSVAAEPGAVAQARMFVRGLQADGGTEMLPALRDAFAGAAPEGWLRQVVLATDAAVGNEEDLLALIESQRGQARLFPVGIGNAPNGYFLRKAAELGRGSPVVIRDINEVAVRMDALLARLDRPAMRDIRIDWPGQAESYPARIPDLYQGEALQVVAKLEAVRLGGDADGSITVSGLGLQPWLRRLPLHGGSVRSAAGVGRVWARGKIDDLEDHLRRGGDDPTVQATLLETALRHQLVSRYTSLVAIERSQARPTGEPLDSTRVMNDGRDEDLMLAQGSTGWLLQLLLASALALLALALGQHRS